jgi:hypothetical protein
MTCHAPVATVTKAVRLYESEWLQLNSNSVAMQGVTCDFCHTISGDEHFGDNISSGAYKYPRKGDTAIKYGAHADARTTNHLTKVSRFLQSAEMCAICHKFNHPLSGEKLQDTYDEWKRGPYSGKGGKRCQDCHMPQFTGQAADTGRERKDLHAHIFPGGHSELVKKVATVTLWGSVKGKSGKRTANLEAVVKNVGSGHRMPTGLPGMREMWLEVVVRDAQGSCVFTNKMPIGIEALGTDGIPTMPWNAVRFGEDTRIGPQESRQKGWEFPMPGVDSGPLKVKVSVYYRSISELAARTAGTEPSPAIEIASDQLRMFADGRVEKTAVE